MVSTISSNSIRTSVDARKESSLQDGAATKTKCTANESDQNLVVEVDGCFKWVDVASPFRLTYKNE